MNFLSSFPAELFQGCAREAYTAGRNAQVHRQQVWRSGGQFVVTLKTGACTSQAGVAPALEATKSDCRRFVHYGYI